MEKIHKIELTNDQLELMSSATLVLIFTQSGNISKTELLAEVGLNTLSRINPDELQDLYQIFRECHKNFLKANGIDTGVYYD